MCNPILTLFYGEKRSKSRSRDYSPLDNPPTGGFCPKLSFFHLNYLYQSNRLATTVHPCNLRQNRRATGARMGLVSKYMFWLTQFNFYAMSRCGLRKLYFECKSTIFMRYYAVNRTHFSDQLAVARWLRLNVTFMYSKKLCAKLNLTHRVIFLLNYTLYLVAIVYFGTCLDLSSQSCCSTANGTSWRHGVSLNSVLI